MWSRGRRGKPGREDFLVEARLRDWIGEAEEAQKGQQNEKTRKKYDEPLT